MKEHFKKKTKVSYIYSFAIPSTSAQSIHVVKLSQEFSKIENISYRLVIKNNDISDSKIYEIYGIRKPFKIIRLHPKKIKMFGYQKQQLFEHFSYCFKALIFLLINGNKLVITRDLLMAWVCSRIGMDTVLDLHHDVDIFNQGKAYSMIQNIYKKNNHLRYVAISHNLKEFLVEKYGVNDDEITVIPDGCTVDDFCHMKKIDKSINTIGYVGKFLEGKGLRIIHELAKNDNNHIYHLWGGTRKDYEDVIGEKEPENVIIHGYVDNVLVPHAIEMCKIMLLPNQEIVELDNNHEIGKFTSPLKMFEYLASGRIVVASDLKILREILDERVCYFADSDSVISWIECINFIEDNIEAAVEKAIRGKEYVNKFSWQERANKILNVYNIH